MNETNLQFRGITGLAEENRPLNLLNGIIMKYILRSKIKHRRFGRSFIFLPVALPKLAMAFLTLDDFLTYQIFLFIFFLSLNMAFKK